MIAALAMMLAISAGGPAQRFAAGFAESKLIFAAGGATLAHASGFSLDTGERSPEAAARAFLAGHGDAFGIGPQQTLLLLQAPPKGVAGAVRFQRFVGGLPIFGGDVVVGVDERARVVLVNSGPAASLAGGRHLIDGEAAARSASASLARGTPIGRPVVAAGWRAFAGTLRPVFQVDLLADRPAGEFRSYVDGETGRVLFRLDLRSTATAPGSIFEVSPVETRASECPISGASHSQCASPVSVTFQNLTSASSLSGTQTSVFNCNGTDAPAKAADVPGACTPIAAVSGGFSFPADGTFQSPTDDFAGAMAYFHLDHHVGFFKSIDPTLPPTSLPGGSGQSRALRGSLPGLVNAHQNGAALENAFFSPVLDAMVFGQGATADYAYDATVMYHELTHGVVFAWGGMSPDIDSLGGLDETSAVNEGTADAMAASETGRSEIGGLIGATSTPATPALRDMADPNAQRSCQGNGATVTQFGVGGVVNGLDGEVHDDGEIWNGFFWEVFDGLRKAGIKGCGGACEAGAAIQYKALQLAAGTGAGFAQYAATMKSAASTLFASTPQVATYLDCVAKRRALDKCDRTVPIFAGETKLQFVRLRFSPFQMVIETTNATAGFGICSSRGTATTIHVRQDQPVQITGLDSLGNPTFAETASATFTQACSGGTTAFSLGTGRWFMMLDSPNALSGGTPGSDLYKVVVDGTGVTARPAAATPATCAMTALPLVIGAASASTPPKGSIQFTASGGSGGNSWSLSTSASGGSIDASSGAYTAGAAGNVTDVVTLRDSSGSTATRNVTVTAGVSIAPASATLASGVSQAFTASGGSGAGFAFNLQPNNSGGSIDATGLYTAGSKAGSDTVHVTDSLGNTASATVVVSAPPGSGSGSSAASAGSGGCSGSSAGPWGALVGLFLCWLKGRRASAQWVRG